VKAPRDRGDGEVLLAVVSVALIVLFAALAYFGWLAGWWFNRENVNRQTDVDRTRSGAQVAYRDEAKRTVRDFYDVPKTETAQRGALRDQACDLIGRLTPGFREGQTLLVNFEREECK